MTPADREWVLKIDERKNLYFIDVVSQDADIKPRYVDNLLKKKGAKECLGSNGELWAIECY